MNYYVATYQGTDYLRSSASREYVCATIYNIGSPSFHSDAGNAGKAIYSQQPVAVVPARQVTAEEFKAINKSKKDLVEAKKSPKRKLREAILRLRDAQHDQRRAGRRIIGIYLFDNAMTQDEDWVWATCYRPWPGELVERQKNQANAYKRMVKAYKVVCELRAQAREV